MEFTRNYMIGYLLDFCTTEEEYKKEEERLTGLTDEALEMEFTDQYNSLQVPAPAIPSAKAIPPTSTWTFKTTQHSNSEF